MIMALLLSVTSLHPAYFQYMHVRSISAASNTEDDSRTLRWFAQVESKYKSSRSKQDQWSVQVEHGVAMSRGVQP